MTLREAVAQQRRLGRVEPAPVLPGLRGPLPAAAALRGRDRLHGQPGAFDVHVCPACGSGRTTARGPNGAARRALPAGVQRLRVADCAGAARRGHGPVPRALPARPAAPAARRLSRRTPGRLLDVGSGRGDLGVSLAPRGWDVTGSSRRRMPAKRRGREVCGPWRGRSRPRAARSGTTTTPSSSNIHWSMSLSRSTTFAPLARCSATAGSRSSRCRTSDLGKHAGSRRTGSISICRDIARTSRRPDWKRSSVAPDSRRSQHPRRRAPTACRWPSYRCFGERRLRHGLALSAATGATLASVPLTALADRDGQGTATYCTRSRCAPSKHHRA